MFRDLEHEGPAPAPVVQLITAAVAFSHGDDNEAASILSSCSISPRGTLVEFARLTEALAVFYGVHPTRLIFAPEPGSDYDNCLFRWLDVLADSADNRREAVDRTLADPDVHLRCMVRIAAHTVHNMLAVVPMLAPRLDVPDDLSGETPTHPREK